MIYCAYQNPFLYQKYRNQTETFMYNLTKVYSSNRYVFIDLKNIHILSLKGRLGVWIFLSANHTCAIKCWGYFNNYFLSHFHEIW